ncbi:hypothetical protein MBRA1_001970 [Malassezia brasiliensis]|uniref:CRAL-TRIO domain-containing protein n=1 Tax=Malassezia brasiliensis TaxID=1821822 RepID=A0AAF0DSN2_9BASI|nr:hypothetical protein MBRA1_001970 [Malassezia brasiliensis]
MGGKVAEAPSESAQHAADSYGELMALYNKHAVTITELHMTLVDEVPRKLASMASYTDEELRIARDYVDDVALIFRFLRRAHFDTEAMRNMLYTTLQWFLEADIDDLATDLLHASYMSDTSNGIPLFWLHSRFRDRLGRPCLALRLQHAERAPAGLRDLKTNIIASMDVVRRYLHHVNRRCPKSAPVLQSVLIIDVAESGISNFELELMPFLVDLFKNHYPGLFGTMYVVNYGWLQSGLWRILKPVLPPKLLARLLFVDKEELRRHFDNALPQQFGGALSIPIAPDTSDVFNFYARSVAWRKPEHGHDRIPPALRSRNPDFESIYDVMSRVGSPYASHNVSPMTMRTPVTSGPSTPRTRASSSPQLPAQNSTLHTHGLDHVSPGLRRHHRRSSDPLLVNDAPWGQQPGPSLKQWISTWMQSSDEPTEDTEDIPCIELPQPLAPAEARPVDGGRTEQTPTEHNTVTHYFSWRAHKYAQMDGHVSPYNIENPYFGYPASYVDHDVPHDEASTTSVVNTTDRSSQPGLSRQLRVRRRKRDLLRTLGYLFVLRLVNLYRQTRHTVIVVYWMVVGHPSHERVSRTISRSLTRTTRGIGTSITEFLSEIRMRSVLVIGMLLVLRLAPLRRPLQMGWRSTGR